MTTHHGGKVGAAAKTLASSSTSKAAKTAAAKTLVKHQIAKLASLRAKHFVTVGR